MSWVHAEFNVSVIDIFTKIDIDVLKSALWRRDNKVAVRKMLEFVVDICGPLGCCCWLLLLGLGGRKEWPEESTRDICGLWVGRRLRKGWFCVIIVLTVVGGSFSSSC